MALVWACERFHLYMYGLPKFDIMKHLKLSTRESLNHQPGLSAGLCAFIPTIIKFAVSSRKNIADALSMRNTCAWWHCMLYQLP